MDPVDSCESWSQRFLAREEVGSTTVAGHGHATGKRIEFLMASVYSHGQKQEVRDACTSTRYSRINASVAKQRVRGLRQNDDLHRNITSSSFYFRENIKSIFAKLYYLRNLNGDSIFRTLIHILY